jgi:hypothetical protein
MDRLLLERGTDVTVKDSLGQTALHVAVENEHDAAVQLLLECNIDPNIKYSAGHMPLFRAVRVGDVEVTKKLLESFVHINIKDIRKYSSTFGSGKRIVIAGSFALRIWCRCQLITQPRCRMVTPHVCNPTTAILDV